MVYNNNINNNNNNNDNNVGVFSNINYNSSTFLKRLSFYVMFVMLLNYFTYKGQCHDWIINITFCIFITHLNKIHCLVLGSVLQQDHCVSRMFYNEPILLFL